MIEMSSKFIRAGSAALVITAAMLSASCVSLLPKPSAAPSIYRLSQLPVLAEPISGAPSLRVSVPGAAKALQGMDIVVSPDGERLAYASGARWSEPIPRLLQDAAMQSLGQSGNIFAIVPPTSVRADFALETRIRSFEADFDRGETSAPLAKVRISATLTDLENRRVIAKKEFYAEQRASEARVSSIVNALDDLTQSVMTDMTGWVQTSMGAAPKRS